MEISNAAKLNPKVRKALDLRTFDPQVFMPHVLDPKIVAKDAERMKAAQAWTAANADCLKCGLCCRQGWRVDVRASDFPRMSEATKERMVEAPPKGAPAHAVGVLRIFQSDVSAGSEIRCAAQTTHVVDGKPTGCDIYEERPETCRTFEVGHERCVVLRAEAGLQFEEDDGMGPPYFGTDNGW